MPSFGVWLQADRSPQETAALAALAEDVGLDFVGVTDGQMIWRDVYVSLAAVAQATSRIRLGPWVTNPITRHPTVTASAICSLDELSGGRAFLGIGVGDDSVRTIHRSPSTMADLQAHVELIHRLAAGDTIEVEGGTWHLASARPTPPPIYWAASNTRSFRAGAAVADGVLDTGWLVPTMLRDALADMAAGAREAGRDPSSVATIFNSAVSIDDDGDAARRIAKTYLARGLMYKRSAEIPGWSEEQRQALIAEYDYYHHLSADHSATDLVPDELIERKSISGSPADCERLLSMVIDAGYTQVALLALGDVQTTIRRYGDVVRSLAG